MKLPEEIDRQLVSKFRLNHRAWLRGEGVWPMSLTLGVPTQNEATRHMDAVRTWVRAWQAWQGTGRIARTHRRWPILGTHEIPTHLILESPREVALCLGQEDRWDRATLRYQALQERWPSLATQLPRHFDVLADYAEADFDRLTSVLAWIGANSNSGLYPRELPIEGIDSKWFEKRGRLLTDLVASTQGDPMRRRDLYRRCGLKTPPVHIKFRFLDPNLASYVGGLPELGMSWESAAALTLPVSRVFIIENIQTGLSFPPFEGAVLIMGLGYDVENLGQIPWVANAECFYWGDLDTHGFGILHRARSHLPQLRSVLMDEETLLHHRGLWVEENTPNASTRLSELTPAEHAVYTALKENRWGSRIRLEQEKIPLQYATGVLRESAANLNTLHHH